MAVQLRQGLGFLFAAVLARGPHFAAAVPFSVVVLKRSFIHESFFERDRGLRLGQLRKDTSRAPIPFVENVTLHTPEVFDKCEARTCSGEKYAFFSHHKSGTVLTGRIAEIFAAQCFNEEPFHVSILPAYGGRVPEVFTPSLEESNLSFHRTEDGVHYRSQPEAWLQTWDEDQGVGCLSSPHVVEYMNLILPQLRKVQRQCGQVRAVHVVRDPVQMVISGYIYHTDSGDHYPWTGPAVYGRMSLAEGIRREAVVAANLDLGHMMETLSASFCDPNILTVQEENFTSGDPGIFDSMTRQIFSHLLGPGDGRIDELVEKSISADLNRGSQTDSTGHVSDPEAKKQAQAVMEEMKASADSAILRIYEMQRQYVEILHSHCR